MIIMKLHSGISRSDISMQYVNPVFAVFLTCSAIPAACQSAIFATTKTTKFGRQFVQVFFSQCWELGLISVIKIMIS